MSTTLKGKNIAIVMADGFEEIEFTSPSQALKEAGANVTVLTPKQEAVKAWDTTDWSKSYASDGAVEEADANQFDALMLPGGVMNPDNLRGNAKAITFISEFLKQKKPVAAICHAPQTLIETGLLKDRTLTSYSSIKTDLKNAGANWQDSEVVVDGNLITSRKPDDLPAFNQKMVEGFA